MDEEGKRAGFYARDTPPDTYFSFEIPETSQLFLKKTTGMQRFQAGCDTLILVDLRLG